MSSPTPPCDKDKTPIDMEEQVTEGSKFISLHPPPPDTDKETAEPLANSPQGKKSGVPPSSWTQNPYAGISLAVCSGLLFTSTGVIVKYLKGVHVLNLGLFRFLGMLLPALPFVITSIIRTPKKDGGTSPSVFSPFWPPTDRERLVTLAFLFARSFMGFASIICYFLAIQHMPVADVSVLGSLSIISVAILAHFTLGEKLGLVTFFAALLTLLGILCIAKPPLLTGKENYDLDTLVGTGLSLARMLFATAAVVLVRRLRAVNGPLVVGIIGLLQLLQNIAALAVLGVFQLPGDAMAWVLHVLLGLLSFASQMALTLALKCEEAGPFSIVRTSTDTLAAFLLQFLIFDLLPDLLSIVGALIISFAVSLTVLRKWVKTRTTSSSSQPEVEDGGGHRKKKERWWVRLLLK